MLADINYKQRYKTYFAAILDNIKKALESKYELESDDSNLAGVRDYMQNILDKRINSINKEYILENGRMDLEKAMIHLFNQSDNKDKIIDIANIYLCVTFLYNINNLKPDIEESMMVLSNKINIIKDQSVQNVIFCLATMLDNRYSLTNTELKDYQKKRCIENIIKIKNCFANLIMRKPYDATEDIKTISLFIFENILYREIIKQINNKDNNFSDLHKQCIIDSIKNNKMNDLIKMFKIEENMSDEKYALYANTLVNLFYDNINEALLTKDSAIKEYIEPDTQTEDFDYGLLDKVGPVPDDNSPVVNKESVPQTSSQNNDKPYLLNEKKLERVLKRAVKQIVEDYTTNAYKDIPYKLLKDIGKYSIIVPKDLDQHIEKKLLEIESDKDWGIMFSSKKHKVRVDSDTNTIYFKYDNENFLCGKIIGNFLVFDSELLKQKEKDHSDATKKSFIARANNTGKKINKFIEFYGEEKFLKELSKSKKNDTRSQFITKF